MLLKNSLLVLVKLYQFILSPFLGGRCRHYPSCSYYAVESLQKHTTLRALQLIFNRVIHCHPLSRRPFFDPVPEEK